MLRRRWDQQGFRHDVAQVPESWLEAPTAAIDVVLDRIEGWPGGQDAWWMEHGASAASLARWRDLIGVG